MIIFSSSQTFKSCQKESVEHNIANYSLIGMAFVAQVGGYRDLMLCCVFEVSNGLKIIGEIQASQAHKG